MTSSVTCINAMEDKSGELRDPRQVYCPAWEVRSGENLRVRVVVESTVTESPKTTDSPPPLPSGKIHSMVGVPEIPSITEMLQINVRISPAVEPPVEVTEAMRAE